MDEAEAKSCLHSAKKFIYRIILPVVSLVLGFLLYCKTYHAFNKDERFYHLRKIIGVGRKEFPALSRTHDVGCLFKYLLSDSWHTLKQGLCVSQATAVVINISAVLIILPVCKTFNKLIHKAFGRVSSRLLAFYLQQLKSIHQFFAMTLVFSSLIHSVVHFINAINYVKHFDPKLADLNWARDEDDNVLRLMFLTPVSFSGWTMAACLIIIWTFSTRQMREYFYNSFLGVHHLFLLFYVLMYYHPVSNIIKYQDNVTNFSPAACDLMAELNTSHAALYMRMYCKDPTFTAGKKSFWIWPSVALLIYFFDLIFRYFRRFFARIKTVSMTLPTDSAILLSFKINEHISLRPGQYILLQCENLSTLEWHPFTITDFVIQPKRTLFTLAISVRGDWTGELYQKIHNLKINSTKRRKSRHRKQPRKLIFVLDGPFPSPMESIVFNERVVLIGAGIGVTPFISIFNYVLKTTKTLTLKRIHLIWIARDLKDFTLFAKTLCDLNQMFWNDNQPDRLQMRFYVTSNATTVVEDGESLRTPEEMFGKHVEFMMARVYSGRPNWNFLFNYWSSLYNREPVSVFSRGPKAMNKDLDKVCRRYKQKGFDFRFVHEASK